MLSARQAKQLISDLKERFLVDKDLGIIVPYFNEGIASTIYKELLKERIYMFGSNLKEQDYVGREVFVCLVALLHLVIK